MHSALDNSYPIVYSVYMMRNKEVIPMNNKSTLAKLLSEEDVNVVHKQMETAYFDSKKRELGLPIWKDDDMTPAIYDLMVGHEIGHALWTPLDMLENAAVRKINHSFVNIIEDARIEKKGKRKYPGLVNVMNRGYSELISKDFFGTAGKDISKMNLIDRINMYFKGNSEIVFTDEEKVWVDRTANTETPDEVLDLAEELYKWMEENMPEDGDSGETDDHPEMSESGSDGEGSSSGETSEEGEGSSSGEKSEGEENGDSDNGTSGDKSDDDDAEDGSSDSSDEDEVDDKEDSGEDSGEGKNNSTEGGLGKEGKKSGGGVPKATTDSAFGKAMDELRDKHASQRTYVNIPKLDMSKIVVSNKTVIEEFYGGFVKQKGLDSSLYWDKCLEEVESLKEDSKKTVGYMVKEFEMKKAADQYARAATSKTGSLDMSKLHTYKYNDDIFRKVTTMPGATNHGMVMVLDWSGSMADNLKGTLAQLFNLIWFCRKVKIPFTVLAFSDAYRSYGQRGCRGDEEFANGFKMGDLRLNKFALLELFTSNMNTSDEMKMMHTMLMYANRYTGYRDWNRDGYPLSPPSQYQLGGTPLNDAIIAMMEYVPQFKKDSGVQKVNTIFLTDGASHSLNQMYDYKLILDGPEKGTHQETTTPCGGHWTDRSITLFKDPITGKSYKCSGGRVGQTAVLLKILKSRTGSFGNLVNFFIAGSGKSGRVDKRTLGYLLPNDSILEIMDKVKFINKNKYLAIESVGFDVAYILPGGNALSVENAMLGDELIGATKAKLKSAFGKSMKSKIDSRQLLNKFIAMVA